MQIQKLMAVVLLALSFSATADFTTITEAYEISVSNMTMPVNQGGTLKFKQCNDCEWQTVLVNSGTQYVLNGANVGLAEFKQQIAGANNKTATVLHHLESNRITAVKIRL